MQEGDNFISEIQQMMYGFGDCQHPLRESAELIEEILRQQMNSMLHQCADVATSLRKCSAIGHEDILFLMRKDKVKLKRLLKYLQLKDTGKDFATKREDINLLREANESNTKRVPKCMFFLKSIDQTGELSSIMSEDVFDEIKLQRAIRLEQHTNRMDQSQYLKYAEARQATFRKKNLRPNFKDWLLKNQPKKTQLTDLAMEIFKYLAYETVAQIVDLALLVKQDAQPAHLQRRLPAIISDTENPSNEGLNEGTKITGLNCIRPDDIREAIRRYFKPNGPFFCFMRADKSNMENRLLCC